MLGLLAAAVGVGGLLVGYLLAVELGLLAAFLWAAVQVGRLDRRRTW
jgi:hypothetical protein